MLVEHFLLTELMCCNWRLLGASDKHVVILQIRGYPDCEGNLSIYAVFIYAVKTFLVNHKYFLRSAVNVNKQIAHIQ